MYKVGDRVRINDKCVPEYVGVVGTVIGVLDDDSERIYDDFILHIKFDVPMGTLEDEYFAVREVDYVDNK